MVWYFSSREVLSSHLRLKFAEDYLEYWFCVDVFSKFIRGNTGEKGRKNRQVYIVWKVVKNSENNVD